MSIWDSTRFVRKGNYLKGSFVKLPRVDGYINSVNPGNLDDALGKFAFSESAANLAVKWAREAQPQWHRAGIEARAQCLQRYREQLALNIEQLTSYLTRETGKPRWEAHGEVLATIARIDVAIEQGFPLLESWWIPDLEGGCEYHPRGVIGVLSTYSMPLQLPNAHIVPALLAGNAVVFKPSKYTPAIGQLIAEMIDRARFPRGVFALVQGSGKVVGARLAKHPDVDAIHLDGSLETAQDLQKILLRHPWKRLVLNTCGRGTAIVLEDAEIDKAAYEVAYGAFLTGGQRRSSTTRVLVVREMANRLIRRLVQILEGINIGYGLNDDVFLGPLISEAARRRFLLYQRATEKEGHEVICRGRRLKLNPNGYYVRPSVFKIDPAIKRDYLTSEHIVGPSLELHVVKDFDEAVEMHNRSRLGLVTSIFTHNRAIMNEARFVLRAGIININRSTVTVSARLPFEGQAGSGNGMSMGLYAIRSCTFPMSYLENLRPFDPSTVMPGIRWPRDETADDELTEDDEDTVMVSPEETTVHGQVSDEGDSSPRLRPAGSPSNEPARTSESGWAPGNQKTGKEPSPSTRGTSSAGHEDAGQPLAASRRKPADSYVDYDEEVTPPDGIEPYHAT